MTLAELPAPWRSDPELPCRDDDQQATGIFRLRATRLEEAIRARADEALSSREVAREGAYSRGRQRHKTAAGEIANVGRKGPPAIQRNVKKADGSLDATTAETRALRTVR